MSKRFNSRKPEYMSDADFTTNAPSYYEDLARKNGLIKVLAKRIWEYDKILYESLAEVERVLKEVIDKIGEGFNQEIYDLLIKWVEDGTLDHIINETLMNKKADITYVDGLILQLTTLINQNFTTINGELSKLDTDIKQVATDLVNGLLSVNNKLTDTNEKLDKTAEELERSSRLYSYKNTSSLSFGRGNVERQNAFSIPTITDNPLNPVIKTDGTGLINGETFITVIHVKGLITNPIDNFYAYFATHDGRSIWLATSPTPSGKWTWQRAVITVGINTTFTDHVSSPSVVFHNNQIYLYYHGMGNPVGGGPNQPTALGLSTDGINFAEVKNPVIHTHKNRRAKFYGLSTSYFKVIKHGSLFMGVFQANNALTNVTSSGVTVSVGFAVSKDGMNWNVAQQPLLSNDLNNRGPFSPLLIKLMDKWCIIYMNYSTESSYIAISDSLEPGSFDIIGEILPKGGQGLWDSKRVSIEDVLFYDNKIYIYYQGIAIDEVGHIGIAEMDWRVL